MTLVVNMADGTELDIDRPPEDAVRDAALRFPSPWGTPTTLFVGKYTVGCGDWVAEKEDA